MFAWVFTDACTVFESNAVLCICSILYKYLAAHFQNAKQIIKYKAKFFRIDSTAEIISRSTTFFICNYSDNQLIVSVILQ